MDKKNDLITLGALDVSTKMDHGINKRPQRPTNTNDLEKVDTVNSARLVVFWIGKNIPTNTRSLLGGAKEKIWDIQGCGSNGDDAMVWGGSGVSFFFLVLGSFKDSFLEFSSDIGVVFSSIYK